MIRFLTVFRPSLIKKVLQRIIVLALAVVIVSLMGTGVLAESWNEFDLFVQDFGWGEETLVSPVSNPDVEVRLIQVPNPPGDPDNFIESCVFKSTIDIPAGTGLALRCCLRCAGQRPRLPAAPTLPVLDRVAPGKFRRVSSVARRA